MNPACVVLSSIARMAGRYGVVMEVAKNEDSLYNYKMKNATGTADDNQVAKR